MDGGNYSPHEQKQMMYQQQQLLLQQLQHQKQQAMSRFPSNIDTHLRTPGVYRPILNPNLNSQQPNSNPISNPNPNFGNQNQEQRMGRPAGCNQTELKLAYEDAWRVCHPDFIRGFVSIEDACVRLLPYHVVADYEAEEDDKILDTDTTGKTLSRPQQWDNNIAAKVADFTGTFEKQVYAFNRMYNSHGQGEFRSEENLIIEQTLLQEETRASLELRAQIEAKEKAGLEARMRMAAMAQAQPQLHALSEMMTPGALGAGLLGSHSNDVSMGHMTGEQKHDGNTDVVMNGWRHTSQRDDEAADDFLNNEENANDGTGAQDG